MAGLNEITINVTWEDIENGIPGTPVYCPIAQAAKREMIGCTNFAVGSFIMWVMGLDRRYLEFALPPEATMFIEAFDTGRDVEPFKFTARKVDDLAY